LAHFRLALQVEFDDSILAVVDLHVSNFDSKSREFDDVFVSGIEDRDPLRKGGGFRGAKFLRHRHAVGRFLGSHVEARLPVESEVVISDLYNHVSFGRGIVVINDSVQYVARGFVAEFSIGVDIDLFVCVPTELPALCGIEAHSWNVVINETKTHISGLITILLVRIVSDIFTGMLQTKVVSDLVHLRGHGLTPIIVVIRIPAIDVCVG